MNATPMNLNPVNVQAQPAAGKQQDAATPDVSFSQVLSSEIAQKRSGSEAREACKAKTDSKAETDVNVGTEATAQPSGSAGACTLTPAKAKETKESARDPLDPLLAENVPAMTSDMLALAIHPDLLKPAPASMSGAQTDQPAALVANTPSALDPRKGRASLPLQAGKFADQAAGTQKIDPSLHPDTQAATPAAATPNAGSMVTAAEFSAQLAAARQSDTAKTGEYLSDLMSTPVMQAAPHTPPEISPGLDGVATNKLTPSVGTTAWGQALGEKIVWMATGAQQTASLTLNPPDMGPLQIVLSVSNDQATASFFSAQPEVRQALESAFPRLREMMNEAGIQLGQATVSADTPQQNDTPDRQAQRIAPPFIGTSDAPPVGLPTVHAPVQQSGRGLVDTFA